MLANLLLAALLVGADDPFLEAYRDELGPMTATLDDGPYRGWYTIPGGVAEPLGLRGYVLLPDRKIACLDLATGRVLWRAGEDWAPVIAMGGGVLVAAPGDTLHSARLLLVVGGEIVERSEAFELGLGVGPPLWHIRSVQRVDGVVDVEIDLYIPARVPMAMRGGRRRRLALRYGEPGGRVEVAQVGFNPRASQRRGPIRSRDGRLRIVNACADLDGRPGAEHCVRSLVDDASGVVMGRYVTQPGGNRNQHGVDGFVGGRMFALGETTEGMAVARDQITDLERAWWGERTIAILPCWLVAYAAADGEELWRRQIRGRISQVAKVHPDGRPYTFLELMEEKAARQGGD